MKNKGVLVIYLFIIRKKILIGKEEESATGERSGGKDVRVISNGNLGDSRDSKWGSLCYTKGYWD
jgi:hypothetical protein